jgi:hypothetical protein
VISNRIYVKVNIGSSVDCSSSILQHDMYALPICAGSTMVQWFVSQLWLLVQSVNCSLQVVFTDKWRATLQEVRFCSPAAVGNVRVMFIVVHQFMYCSFTSKTFYPFAFNFCTIGKSAWWIGVAKRWRWCCHLFHFLYFFASNSKWYVKLDRRCDVQWKGGNIPCINRMQRKGLGEAGDSSPRGLGDRRGIHPTPAWVGSLGGLDTWEPNKAGDREDAEVALSPDRCALGLLNPDLSALRCWQLTTWTCTCFCKLLQRAVDSCSLIWRRTIMDHVSSCPACYWTEFNLLNDMTRPIHRFRVGKVCDLSVRIK